MGDPGNPTDPSGEPGTGPDPEQPGWASPTPPAAPPPQAPPPPPPPATSVPAAPDAGWTPPPPPAKKRKLTWLWILIPTLLVLAVSVIVIAVFVVRAVIGPLEATDDYFALLRQERYAEAYNERCEEFRGQITQEDFVRREQASGRVGDFDIDSFETHSNDTATTEGEAERAGIEFDVTVSLRKEDGDWKICGIEAQRK